MHAENLMLLFNLNKSAGNNIHRTASATTKNHLVCYQNKDWRHLFKVCFYRKTYLQWQHILNKVDKCGGEIAKLATSSHNKTIETSEEIISCKDTCHQDTFQITTTLLKRGV